jgi:beta-galactosidase
MFVSCRIYALLICVVGLLGRSVVTLAGPPHQDKHRGNRPGRTGRDTLVIDDTWRFLTDPSDRGETAHWEKSVPEQAGKIVVPSLWTTQGAPGYTGTAWYWRAFTPPLSWQGQRVRLRFEGAAETARIWLNGQLLGEHSGGVTPFEFDVTKTIHVGMENLLAVRLAGNSKSGAGLWQGVELLAHDEAYLADCFPQADAFGHLSAAITFRNTSTNSGDAVLDARVVAADAPTREVKRTLQNLHLTPGDNQTTLLLTVSGKMLRRWSPQTPVLYLLQLSFRQDQDILDTLETAFGFRDLGLQDSNLTLNGEAIKPAALAPDLTQPVVIASTEDEASVRNLLRHVKSAGANLVYLDAPPAALLRLADQEGLLVIEGARKGELPSARNTELHALVLRDRAHPCVIGWNLGEATEEEVRALRRLDPTRFLLAGPRTALRLWLPGQDTPSAAPLPPGLLPKP